jgi:GT2 family glycosyltransferase
VDDGSSDGTTNLLGGLRLPYAIKIVTQANRGPAAARNLGVEHSRGDLILFLDDDVVPRRDLITTHLTAQQISTGCVIVGRISPPENHLRPIWIRWDEEMLQRKYVKLRSGKQPCTPREFFTANASLSRARFVEVGGFDPCFKRAEDVELGYRLRDYGAQFRFEYRAEVIHHASRSFEAWCRTAYAYGRYDVLMQRDKGHEQLSVSMNFFHRRHVLSRILARSCVGRPSLVRGAVLALGSFARLGGRYAAYQPAILALSGVFNLLYWQGVCDELGSAEALWRGVEANVRSITPGQ